MLLRSAIVDPGYIAGVLGRAPPRAWAYQFQSRCGFSIEGAGLCEAFALGARLKQFPGPGVTVQAEVSQPLGALALFVLEGGRGVVMPIIPEFIATLTMAEGELIDVAYEPSAISARAVDYADHALELSALRKVIAEAALQGELRIETNEANMLAKRLQSLKGADPALSVYVAYLYDGLHRQELITELDRFLERDLGASLFDVAMLLGRLDRRSPLQWPAIRGFAPLLSQGWATLRARGIRMPEGCEGIDTMVTNSLWTTFTPEGVARLRSTVFRGAEPWQHA
jgi:hypothetical protein